MPRGVNVPHPTRVRKLRSLLLLLLPFCLCLVAGAQAKPVDVSLGWNFSHSDQGDGHANLNGWYGTATWEESERFGFSFQHQDFWGSFHRLPLNQHAWLIGLTFRVRKGNPRISPFVQTLGGATRSSYAGNIQWEPTIQVAGGAHIRIKGNLSLELIPGEYVLTFTSAAAEHTYQAGVGLQYTLGQ